MFKPVIHECEVNEGDEQFKFWVREPSGREILIAADRAKKNPDRAALDNAKELFSKYVVHEDGTALAAQEVEDMLDMRLSAMNKVSEQVQEKIGIKKIAEAKNV